MIRFFNIIADGIAIAILLLGGLATLLMIASSLILTGITALEFATLVLIAVFLVWRTSRWWK